MRLLLVPCVPFALALLAAPASAGPLGRYSLNRADATIDGASAGAQAGIALWARDDLDGDGVADLLVGASGVSSNAGAVYVMTGPISGAWSLSDADITISNASARGKLGWGVASPGDMDGDGDNDLLLGAPEQGALSSNAGSAWYWGSMPASSTSTSSADGQLTGEESGDQAGIEVCPAGDTDGDGNRDLVVGAWYNDRGGTQAGAVYVFLEPPSGSVSLSTADGLFTGEAASDWAGKAVCGGGDVDGDGFDDIIVGADGSDIGGSNAGVAYLLHGPATGTASLSTAGTWYQSEAAGNYTGHAVAIVGDHDGDGDDDLMVGAFGRRAGVGTWHGGAYLMTGEETGRTLLRSPVWRVFGTENGGMLGYTVAPAGDVDGDGYADATVGLRYSDLGGTDSGAAFLLYGPLAGRPQLTSNAALIIGTAAGDEASWAMDGGDLDDDGYSDVVVSAPFHDSAGTDAGRIYVINGSAR